MNKINVLVLAAGQGSRFKEYTNIPKPFINVLGMPMYEHALSFLNIKNEYETHLLFQEEYAPTSKHTVHTINRYTEGAAESAYTVVQKHKNEPWLIMDCDAVIETDSIEYNHSSILVELVSTFDTRASYSLIHNNKILCTAEKQVISKNRNVGVYFWSSGEVFCESYEYARSIEYKINNEYYISPLYNIAIRNGENVIPTFVNRFVPIGVPTDLEKYINENNCT